MSQVRSLLAAYAIASGCDPRVMKLMKADAVECVNCGAHLLATEEYTNCPDDSDGAHVLRVVQETGIEH